MQPRDTFQSSSPYGGKSPTASDATVRLVNVLRDVLASGAPLDSDGALDVIETAVQG